MIGRHIAGLAEYRFSLDRGEAAVSSEVCSDDVISPVHPSLRIFPKLRTLCRALPALFIPFTMNAPGPNVVDTIAAVTDPADLFSNLPTK